MPGQRLPAEQQRLHRHGIRFLRTYARDARDWLPVPFDVQPFWYAQQGFADVLECCVQGYQDDFCYASAHPDKPVEGYWKFLMDSLDELAGTDMVHSFCAHDGSSTSEEKLGRLRDFYARAQELGYEIINYCEFYERALACQNEA